MNAKERKEQYEEAVRRQQEESFNRKDDSGRFKSIYKDSVDKKLFWKCNEGEHLLDIIPYVAGDNNPHAKKGEPTYVLDIWRHSKVGVNEDSFVCLSRTFKKPCPVCDWQTHARATGDYDDEFLKSLNPSRRVIYNIHVLDNEVEKRKGIQIWEVAHWSFERNLVELASKAGKKVLFAAPVSGKNISFRRKGMKATNTEYTALSFEERSNPPSDAILDAAYTLEDFLHVPTYDEVAAAIPSNEITDKLFGKKGHASIMREEPPAAKDDVPFEVASDECPYGHVFGEDNRYYDECETCENKEACSFRYDELELEKKEKAEEEERLRAEEEARKKEEALKAERRAQRGSTPPDANPVQQRRRRT